MKIAVKNISLAVFLLLQQAAFAEVPTRTVSWYLAHKEELKKQIAVCNDNPGELQNTPNCFNAQRANGATGWAESDKGAKLASKGAAQSVPLKPSDDHAFEKTESAKRLYGDGIQRRGKHHAVIFH